MGDSTDDVHLTDHIHAGPTPQGIVLRVHHGSFDVTLPETNATERGELITAAGVSQAAFDAKAATIWGTPYSGMDTGKKALSRVGVGRLVP